MVYLLDVNHLAKMELLQHSSSEDNATLSLDFSRLLLIGDSSSKIEGHLRAWKLCGVDPVTVRSQSIILEKFRGYLVDSCCSSPAETIKVCKKALSLGMNVLTVETTGPFEIAKEFEKNNLKFIAVDSLRNNPLIEEAVSLISENRIGEPRILRLELLRRAKDTEESASLRESLTMGLKAARYIFEPRSLTRVFATKVKTRSASFFVIVANFGGDEAIAHIIAGNSVDVGKIEFTVNGTKGMFTSHQEFSLEAPKDAQTTSTLESASSVEALSATFSNLMKGKARQVTARESAAIQLGVKAVLDSSKSGKPVDVVELQ